MSEHLLVAFTLIGVLGVGAQWIAWRMNLPAIVLMAAAGLLIGPIFGWIHPEEDFGEFYRPLISVAVAVILFEGGLQLKFSELRGLGRGVGQLVLVGGPLAWIFGSLAGHYVAGLTWPTAVLFAGIMIVTGPTVIMPLLRQAKLSTRPAALLKWEGIINDPIGALAAVIVFEYVHRLANPEMATYQIFGSLIIGTALCTFWGILLGWGLAQGFRRGWVPEFLKSPVLLTSVLLGFTFANFIQEEGGLLAVTAMGVTMANAKMPSINQLRHFKENIAILFVAGVFVILTANLSWDVLRQIDGRIILFVLTMLFVVRPLSVILGTIGTELKWSERLLVGWIAPRGIVAVAVSGLFAASMTGDRGFVDGELMVPLAFAMVFATVILHGFTISPLGKALDLAMKKPPGILVVGASPWSTALAQKLLELEVPILITDTNYRSLRAARQAGLETYYGEILSEVTEHHIELVRYGHLLALTGNDAYNALVCTDLSPEMNRAQTYQLSSQGTEERRNTVSFTLQGRTFLKGRNSLEDLLKKHWAGWSFQFTRLSDTYTPEDYRKSLQEGSLIVMVQRKSELIFQADENPITLQAGDRVLAYCPPEEKDMEKKDAPSKSRNGDGKLSSEELEAKKQEAISRLTP